MHLRKHFPTGILQLILHHIYTNHNQIPAKISTVSKWRPKTYLRFAKKSRDQDLTNQFPKEIFQLNVAQIRRF